MTTNIERLASNARGDKIRATSRFRRQVALALYECRSDLSQRDVGKRLGVSKNRAGELIRRARRERAALTIKGEWE